MSWIWQKCQSLSFPRSSNSLRVSNPHLRFRWSRREIFSKLLKKFFKFSIFTLSFKGIVQNSNFPWGAMWYRHHSLLFYWLRNVYWLACPFEMLLLEQSSGLFYDFLPTFIPFKRTHDTHVDNWGRTQKVDRTTQQKSVEFDKINDGKKP